MSKPGPESCFGIRRLWPSLSVIIAIETVNLSSVGPKLLTFLSAMLVLYNFEQITQIAFGQVIAAGAEEVVSSMLLLCVIEGFFIFTLSLYIGFNKTQNQLAYREISYNSHAEADEGMAHSINTYNYFLSDRFACVWDHLQSPLPVHFRGLFDVAKRCWD
jgi:hypothetical protein